MVPWGTAGSPSDLRVPEIRRLYGNGESVNAIARLLHVDNGLVRRVLGKAVRSRSEAITLVIARKKSRGESWGSPRGHRNKSFKNTLAAKKSWLQREYVDKQRSSREIAQEVGLSQPSILRWLCVHGIPVRHHLVRDTVGDKNSNWKGGITRFGQSLRHTQVGLWWRAGVLARGHCERCGSRNRLEAHHAVPFCDLLSSELKRYKLRIDTPVERSRAFKELRIPGSPLFILSNGVCLCHRCHVKVGIERIHPLERRCRA